mgnify:CR=1 FL=1
MSHEGLCDPVVKCNFCGETAAGTGGTAAHECEGFRQHSRHRQATTDGKPPRPGFEDAGAPAPLRIDGQHEAYWVLPEEERQKGFVRPVRRSYRHVGVRPKYPTRDLTPEEHAEHPHGYVAYEEYPKSARPLAGRYWTAAQLKSGCGAVTTMGLALAETYARDPAFYGATFCATCANHCPVGTQGEFTWEPDGSRVGT